jgi:hypothetical protein
VSYAGTTVLARSGGTLLVHRPEVRAAFGSRWARLEDLGDGWQLVSAGRYGGGLTRAELTAEARRLEEAWRPAMIRERAI